MNIDERELHQTMEEFLEQDKRQQNIWNFATISGLVILFLVSSYVMQLIVSRSWGPDLSGIIQVLPVIGGVILVIVGFGFLAGNKKRGKSSMLENDIERGSQKNPERESRETGYQSTHRKAEPFQSDEEGEEREKEGASYSGRSSNTKVDSYGLRQTKKLYKSRTDKKLCGVCGGLAKYFGIGSTMVRVIFVVLTLIGWGSAAILYLALCIVLKKEPLEMMEDFKKQDIA